MEGRDYPMQVKEYATDERVRQGAAYLDAGTTGPNKRARLAEAAGAAYYSRPFVQKVNDTIPHRYVCASVVNDEHAVGPGTIEIGDILFAYHPDRAPANHTDTPDVLKLGTYSQRNDPNTTHAVSWQYLDLWLQHHSKRYTDAHQLTREWQLLGVAHNDVLPGGFGSFVNRNTPSRALNVVVGGRVATSNIWGKDAFAGKHLYFLVARDKHTERWHLNPVASYKQPKCELNECVIKVGVVIESPCEDPFLTSLQTTERKAEYVRIKRMTTQKVVFYLGI